MVSIGTMQLQATIIIPEIISTAKRKKVNWERISWGEHVERNLKILSSDRRAETNFEQIENYK